MREIKYRAWDRKELKMFEVKALEFVDGCDPIAKGAGHYTPNVDLMQYIGLKDKNRKEIYEGDIVQDGEDGNIYNGRIGVVEFARENSKGMPINGYWYRVSPDEAGTIYQKRIKVIGNIYENPELLK